MCMYVGPVHNTRAGLPAKTGVSGGMFCVVPNLMGIAIYSPLIDQYGHPVRGVEFMKLIVARYQLSIFDRIISGSQ